MDQRHYVVPTDLAERLELGYVSLPLSTSVQDAHTLTAYTAEPGTASEDALRLLASWAATDATQARETAAGAS